VAFDPISQYQKISAWCTALPRKTHTARGLVQSLGYQLRSLGHPVSVTTEYDSTLADNEFIFCANYHWDQDQEREPRYFEIVLVLAESGKTAIVFTEQSADEFAVATVETLAHEYQHQHQYRSRNYREPAAFVSKHTDPESKDNQEYLGSADEVDAYARNIAFRLWCRHGSAALDILSTKRCGYEDSPDLYTYNRYFDVSHPVMRRLLKKITVNIAQLSAAAHK
jgi:hypothetical protein